MFAFRFLVFGWFAFSVFFLVLVSDALASLDLLPLFYFQSLLFAVAFLTDFEFFAHPLLLPCIFFPAGFG